MTPISVDNHKYNKYIVFMEGKQINKILLLPAGPRKTAALAEWLQNLYQARETPPVLVGGGAVELFTGGAYVTGDMDLVGTVPAAVGKVLSDVGFTRHGRHWIHEEGRIFFEFPSTSLSPSEKAEDRIFHGHRVLIVSPEDLLVDRLSAWSHWESELDGVNAYLLYRALVAELDHDRIQSRCLEEDVSGPFDRLENFFREHQGEIPDGSELEEWARNREGKKGAR
ncbi:MAG: hypothetical protein RRA15_03280 [bacterium]|nr:hypothetical protein [bacterium]